MAVVPDFAVAEHVGELLGHQRSDLLHRRAQLQVAQVQARRQHLLAAPVVGQLLLVSTREPGGGGRVPFFGRVANVTLNDSDGVFCRY